MRLLVPVAAAILFAGCGYVGDPLPPALNIPTRVTDLTAVQRGDKLLIRFTAPSITTEQLGIRSFGHVDLRVGAVTQPFSMEVWQSSATEVPVAVPEPGAPVTVEVAAGTWAGREILVAVRFVSSRDRRAGWSNTVAFTPQSPLPTPAPTALSHPEGVEIRWTSSSGTKYRVRKQPEGAPAPVEIGTADTSPYIDRAVELGKTYAYDVQSVAGLVESAVSTPVRVTVRDEFAPKAPSGVTIVAGQNSVELAWERNTEADHASYRVYRAEGAAEFTVLADALEVVAYSDRQVEGGKTYRYRMTALDRSGNESQPSAVVQATTAP